MTIVRKVHKHWRALIKMNMHVNLNVLTALIPIIYGYKKEITVARALGTNAMP